VLTTVVAFYSLTLVEGEFGQLFSQFAIVAIFCLIFSLVESKLILPAHLAYLKEDKKSPNRLMAYWQKLQNSVANGLQHFTFNIYQPILKKLLCYRYATLFMMVAIFIFVIGLFNNGVIRFVFFPSIPGNVISVNVSMEEGVGYALTHREALRIEQVAIDLNKSIQEEYSSNTPVIDNIQVLSNDANTINIVAELVSRDIRPVSISEVTQRWKELVGSIEGSRSTEFTAEWAGLEDIRIELSSADSHTLSLISDELAVELASFKNVSNIKNSLKAGQSQINLELNALGHAVGLTMADLSSQIQQNFQGYEVQRVQRDRDEIKVQVRYPKIDRSHADDLLNAKIRTNKGEIFPLSAIATINSTEVASEIIRVNRNKVAILTADVNKAIISPNEILAKLEKTSFANLRLIYPDITIRLDGEAAEEKESLDSLVNAFLLALFGIYALLAIPLRSYSQPAIVMLAIPFGVVGALVGHLICNIPVSILSIFGMLALTGVVVNDSLLLIARFNDLRNEGVEYVDAICQSGTSRMRAIILTSSTTFAGLAPLISETSEQAQFLIPAAVSLGYGILFATLITLILIPICLLIAHDINSITTKKVK
jgi:multidrug efflux pump subunit AcrB